MANSGVCNNRILLVDKPTGMTSFDVIRRLRKQLGIRKIGHAGTLDPAASGLLILATGAATKQLNVLTGLDKRYTVTARIGERRDTGDMDGAVVRTDVPAELTLSAVERALKHLTGDVTLPVPRYAAVKVDGEPLYKKARRGEAFDPPERTMQVHELICRDVQHGDDGFWYVELDMHVGKGTYVRSIIEALGEQVGYPAVVFALRRTQIGEYSVENARTLEQF